MTDNIIEHIKQGERSTIKYFHNLEPPNLIAKIITAFANSGGGTIVFGVKDNIIDLKIKGLSPDFNSKKTFKETAALVEKKVQFTINQLTYEGKQVVYLTIEKSKSKALFEGRKYIMKTGTTKPELYKDKIFISHSSIDKQYGEAIVELLRGLGLKREQIIFTSNDNYGIPLNSNIFDYLKEQINDGVHMIYLLSDNYYNSVACLNEMGAAWIVQNQYTVIGVPDFHFNNEKFQNGVIDPRRIGFLMNNKNRIVEFKNNILKQFDLKIDEVDWNELLDKHMNNMSKIS
ncbi:RNA-binding domain-containing protein [Peribacillus simplex]|uniref:RNA-binding domain-containing protein n=1 Tax=Peribacillus simplex TaxID=1478 RepID=UPI00366C7462